MNIEQVYEFAEKIVEYKNKYFKDTYKVRFVVFRVGSKKNVKGWFDENTFLSNFDEIVKEDPFVVSVSYTLLPNEFVIETDIEGELINRSLYNLILNELERRKWKYYMVYSGGKSIHFHVLINPRRYNNDINKLKRLKQKIYSELSKIVYGIDAFGFKEHPYRIPGSKHPETRNMSELLADPNGYFQFVPNNFESLENDIVINIDDNQNFKYNSPTNKKKIKRLRKDMSRGLSNTLYNLYGDLLTLRVNDGRDRVLLMLYTIANTLKIDPEQFEKDLYQWATNNNWKEYKWRRWIDYYREGRYTQTWGKNWRWAIRHFLNSKDIESNSYNEIKRVLEPYLGKLKIKTIENDKN